jgi:hypothetical protein
MMRVLYILAAVLLAAARPAAALEFDETVFTSRQLGIRLEAPDGWVVTQQTGYPSIPVLLLHQGTKAEGEPRPTIRLALGAEGTGSRLRAFLRDNIAGVKAVGIRVVRSDEATIGKRAVLRVELRGEEGKVAVKQLYLSHGTRALVLTLAAAASRIESFDFDLRRAVQLMELTRPTSGTLQPRDAVSYPKQSPNDDGTMGPDGQEVEERPNKPTSRPSSRPSPTTAPQQEIQVEGLEPAP